MRCRVLIPLALGISSVVLFAGPKAAWAGDGDGENTFAGAQASGGQLTVQAGVTDWTPPAGSSLAQTTGSDSTSAAPNPNQPTGCTYGAGGAAATATLGVGGPEPGQWVFPVCTGPGAVDPMLPIWVSDAQTVPTAPLAPAALAEQAEKELGLPSPAIETAPPNGSPQLVGVATWLWIDPGAWQTLTASATAGPVTATATAVPTKVVWDMGDGDTVTCDGPGTPYSSSDPDATTDCSYTWPDPGSYTVTATVYWSVTWTATGAAGGGNLGEQGGPAAQVAVQVTESQAINTPSGASG